MPGDEDEDIVMTSTQSNLLNPKCPLTGKPITELTEPVRRCYIFYKHAFSVTLNSYGKADLSCTEYES